MDGSWTVPGYRHVRTLGSGASGTVVLALDKSTGTPVAIKYLSDNLRTDETFLQRFRAEAQLMAELDHPSLVRFYEYVEGPQAAAVVMELVDGVTLNEIIKTQGPTGPEAALVVLKGSLLGLGAAHAVGVVHRDYKPGNVLVREDGISKLADFGIAVRAGQDVNASGTPAYMAPEQWARGMVTPATDVYAATAVFYECLTGERPYPIKGLWALAAAHRMDPIPSDRVPEELRGLVERGMAKDFADRPPTADAFLAELEQVALAAYGPDWETRGRARLAALAGLLASLFPLAQPIATAGTALALTRLGRRRAMVATGLVTGALITGGGSTVLLVNVDHHLPAPKATSTLAEPSTSPPTDSPSPTPTPTDSPTPSPTGTIAMSPSPTPVVTKPITKVPKPVTKPTPTKVTGLKVRSVSIQQAGDLYTATATVTITIQGPKRVPISATFITSSQEQGSAPGSAKGTGFHIVSISWSFNTCATTVRVTASAGGLSNSGSGKADCPAPPPPTPQIG